MWKAEYDYRRREKYREELKARARIRMKGVKKFRDPIKEKARHAVRNAVVAGRLIKPVLCPRCGQEGRIQAHHSDYSKPFEIEWLCGLCHGLEHRGPRVAKAAKLGGKG